jgi:YVTN family beta-propeller protein
VRATIPACAQPGDIAILPDSSKAFVACTGAAQVASIDLKSGKVLALLDVGKTPVNLALKPDGGELMVCNSDSDSISIIETSTDEVGESHLIGTHPVRGLVTADNSRLYVSDSGSNTVATYDIDSGTLVRPAIPFVGGHPDGLALSQNQNYLLVLDSQSGDVMVIQRRVPRKKFETGEYSLLTMIPVGLQPNDIVVKWFVLAGPEK